MKGLVVGRREWFEHNERKIVEMLKGLFRVLHLLFLNTQLKTNFLTFIHLWKFSFLKTS